MRACTETYEGGSKRSCHQYKDIGISSGSKDYFSGGQLHLQPISPMEVAF